MSLCPSEEALSQSFSMCDSTYDEHLRSCETCRSSWQEMQEMRDMARSLSFTPPAAASVETVRAAILSQGATVTKRSWGRAGAVLLAAAAAWAIVSVRSGSRMDERDHVVADPASTLTAPTVSAVVPVPEVPSAIASSVVESPPPATAVASGVHPRAVPTPSSSAFVEQEVPKTVPTLEVANETTSTVEGVAARVPIERDSLVRDQAARDLTNRDRAPAEKEAREEKAAQRREERKEERDEKREERKERRKDRRDDHRAK